ncbi:3-beta hydroxysteroid dehydrogenase/isomerase [Sodiomyces alkalinus F11]|uniref:Sterol-4-alpha-carboxylate 3-dehydrogenase ERG26, decarboxylating n=1 Tax=Sodiomyces alkalinus (strain CBS 110278 / VKM F-3762 / F11) TaxID=1314773 RepID=A0A3N2PS76_SODAK|nr:3-beta hydroxysteroid dehydrogenase/isomerase [Sodiomyces alkalinus F11]ROT37284.1 3-beta hydroxysteroid dehydrogenase/isomerase [Sodiomyces alkalinus F11]
MSEKPVTTAQKARELGRVLVIGGNGFLGHHIVNQILDDPLWAASHLSVIDLRCTRNRRPDTDKVAYYEANISDAEKVHSILEQVKPDVVIHTASPAPQGDDDIAKDLFKRVNVDGTAAVIAACQQAGVKALVYTSSASVVTDNSSNTINADERWPLVRGDMQPEYYTETKAAAEELVLAANRKDPHPTFLTTAIRPAGIFGEGDGMVTHQLIKIYRQRRTGFQIGDGENLFDFTYVGNVAHAHLLAARLLLVTHRAGASSIPLDYERVDGEAFFVTNDSPVYFWDFARAVWRAAGSDKGTGHVWAMSKELGLVLGFCSEVFFHILGKPPTFTRQRCTYSCMTRYYNISKAKRVLGYQPIVSLDDGIKRGVRWFLEQEAAGLVPAAK